MRIVKFCMYGVQLFHFSEREYQRADQTANGQVSLHFCFLRYATKLVFLTFGPIFPISSSFSYTTPFTWVKVQNFKNPELSKFLS